MVELGRLHELGGFESANLSDALEFYESALQATESSWAYVDGMGESAQQYRQQAKSGKQRVTQKLQGLSVAGSSESRSSLAGLDFGTYHVLIVANQSYDNIASLTTPRRDAALVGSVLESKFDASVEYLFDATRTDLLSALNRYRKSLGPSDNFILYYAGHGVYDEELKVGYWQPIDATPQDDYTWVDTDRISRTVSGFKSRNALVIADSCFSGSVVRGGDFAVNESNSATALLALNGKKTRMAITSGGLQPVLDVTGNSENSAFASNLASALNAVDRPVPISLLFPQIRSSVTAETAAWGFEQIPEMAPLYKAGHDGGDFILSPQIQASN